ncbi:hypothetical protein CPB84DRAFT_1846077 [Gymnopilus junonius]|uniref:Uncharacterized protein n=1 Tax=Gymnopilus junonius TaxID=109634 RepID=A0A9P5TQ62_GYMJU|nr:hypothetical protein CPB84DRAFT_1846077 [Gymnopilus junonius]
MLRANEKKTSYNAIESNFIRAAIHIGCQRMVVFPEHMVPDLPGNLQKLGYSPTTNQEADSSLGVDLTVSQSYHYEFINYGADKPKSNLAADHVMLTVAEFLTPFYLWMPFKLTKKSFGHCTVLDRASRLGPDKPPTVLNVEMACWKTVFHLSEGCTKPYHALRDLALSIDWQEVDQASSSVHEHTWFNLEERPLECALDIRVIPVPDEEEDAMSTSSPVSPSHSLSASQSTDVPAASTINAAVIADELPPTTSMLPSPSPSTSLLPPGCGETNLTGVEGLLPLQSSPIISDVASPSPSSNSLMSRPPELFAMSPAVSQSGISETLVPSLELSASQMATINPAPPLLQLLPIIGNAASPFPPSNSLVSTPPEVLMKSPAVSQSGVIKALIHSLGLSMSPMTMINPALLLPVNSTVPSAQSHLISPPDPHLASSRLSSNPALDTLSNHQASPISNTFQAAGTRPFVDDDEQYKLAASLTSQLNASFHNYEVEMSDVSSESDSEDSSQSDSPPQVPSPAPPLNANMDVDDNAKMKQCLNINVAVPLPNPHMDIEHLMDDNTNDEQASPPPKQAMDVDANDTDDETESNPSDLSDTSKDDSTYKGKKPHPSNAGHSRGSKKKSSSEVQPAHEPSSKATTVEKKEITSIANSASNVKGSKPSSALPGPGVGLNSYLQGGKTSADPIDVDAYVSLYEPTASHDYLIKEELSFDSKHSHPCIKCDMEMEAYNAVENKVTFRPEFHFEDYIIRFKQIMERVEQGYVKGCPPHIKTPDLSCIHILSYFIFSKMGTSELDAIMIRHLLVTGCPLVKDIKFDEDGMRELAPLLTQVSINDFSIKAGPGICMPAVVVVS